MHETAQAAALEGVDRCPIQREILVPDHLFDARNDALGLFFDLGIGVPAQLQVNPVDVVRLLVQQRRLAIVKAGLKPEPAFPGEVGLHLDVGNQEAFFKELALKLQPQHPAQGAAGAVTGDHPIGLKRIAAIGGFHRQHRMIGLAVNRDHLVFPAQINVQRYGAVDQILLDVILLQVHEGGHLVAVFGQKVKVEHLAVAVEGAAHLPRHALLDAKPAHTQPVQNFKAALGPADRPAADRDNVVVIQNNAGNSVIGQFDRHGKADGPSPDDGHLVARFGGGQAGRGGVGKGAIVVRHQG